MKPSTIKNDRQLIKTAKRIQKRINDDRRLLSTMRDATGDKLHFLILIDTHLAEAQTMLRNFTGKDMK